MTVIDVSEASFEQDVVLGSRQLPVVVDFWASWCGPCRALGPLLEEAARQREGKVVLAKLDTDANPNLAGAFQIRGIPAVKAFRDGEVVAEFVGAQDRAAVERFFDQLLPSEADALIAGGSEDDLWRALELEPANGQAAVPLARLLIARGESERAAAVLEPVIGSFQAEGLRARLRLEGQGTVNEALRLLDEGQRELALDWLLRSLPTEDSHRDDVRLLIVGELDALGVDHPVARETRRRLAAALY